MRDLSVDQGHQNQEMPDFSQDASAALDDSKRICPNCGLKLSTDIAICPNDGTVLSESAAIGSRLADQYEYLSEIGSGGMGVIYKARHVALNQIVAIKMMHKNRMDEVSVRRFQQEAKAVTALDHPSIVRVRDFGVSDAGQPHMVLDFIEGDTLATAIRKSAGLAVDESLEIFIQGCDALEHAHSRGVLHRDLKPSNIMLVPRLSGPPLVKIVDFGIAKINNPDTDNGVMNLTQTGEVFGSPLYMSPEQASGAKLDKRSDIYSFGCVMYETLTGAPPFVGGSSIETIFRQLNDPAPSLKEGSLGKDFPAELEAIVARALEKKPENRFQSMSELKRHLLTLKSGKSELDSNQATNADSKSNKRFEVKALLAALLLLIVLAAGSGYLVVTGLTSKEKPVEPVPDDQMKAKQIIAKDVDAAEIDLSNLKLNDKMLELFAAPTSTKSVKLSNTSVTGPGLANLIHLPLKSLSLNGSPVTDRALEDIGHMDSLENLDLRKTAITDAGLNNLRGLTALKELDISEDAVGKRACLMLKYWPVLTVLKMDKTNIDSTDAYA
ncbi:MAG: serine/threonine protein kinase, partial [Cyanobacteria bacterium SZAS LIN-5]|nr:serine/threonine protein kinase [Cyanobacteria bacterium SZAS LIN-5]